MQLEEFPEADGLQYAILSHRWQDDEVSFQDMQSPDPQRRHGYAKLQQFCLHAARDNYKYAWVDTCCIDKSSSAELSESINSMYRWYENARKCYAYLFDVHDDIVSEDSQFARSEWFRRGWTLQELIAPGVVEFYNSEWVCLGTKYTFEETIQNITGIDGGALYSGNDFGTFSVAARMSWASSRKTTRIEDVAYSLLGLFEVNMPLLYGEGKNAFIRLQEEIMKRSDDHSLFAWSSKSPRYRGLLAESPSDFQDCRKVVRIFGSNRTPYLLTNMGLSIQLPLMPYFMDMYLAPLNCRMDSHENTQLGIFLRLLPEGGQFARVKLGLVDKEDVDSDILPKFELQSIYVRQSVQGSMPHPIRMYGFRLGHLPEGEKLYLRRYSLESEDSRNLSAETPLFSGSTSICTAYEGAHVAMPTRECGTVGLLWRKQTSGLYYAVVELMFDTNFSPILRFGLSSVEPSDASFDEHWLWKSLSELKGDRLRGLQSRTASITEKEIGNLKMWVVDLMEL